MTRPLIFGLAVALCTPFLASQAFADDIDDMIDAAKKKNRNSLELYYASQSKSKLNEGEAVKIPAKTLDLEWGQVKLDGGWLVPVTPKKLTAEDTEGREVPEREELAAVYLGTGTFTFEVPHETEKFSMNEKLRQLGVKDADFDTLEVALDGGTVLFFGGKWGDLLREGSTPAELDSKSTRLAKKLWKARGDLWLDGTAAAATTLAAQGRKEDLLILDMPTKTFKNRVPWLTYMIDPEDSEPVSLMVYKRHPLNRDTGDQWSLVSWFDQESVDAKSLSENTLMATDWDLDAEHYDLNMRVYRDKDENVWGMDVEGWGLFSVKHATRVASLELFSTANGHPVKVGSVRTESGEDLEFMHKTNRLVIKLDREYKPGEEVKIAFTYGGLMITSFVQPSPQTSLSDEAAAGAVVGIVNYSLNDNAPWYPMNSGHSDFYTFDWRVTTPKPMIAVTSGTLLSMTQEGKNNVHVVRETTPVSFPAMVFGKFVVRENNPDYEKGEIKIRVYNHPGFEKDAQLIIDEAQGIIAYYSSLFGDYAYKELDICQWPLRSGGAQAPAGLVRMTGETYISKTDLMNLYGNADPHIRDALLPHEIGHEWWGHVAGFSSYRDQWVSETFAEYSSALYLEERQKRRSGDPNDESGYEGSLEDWTIGRRAHLSHRTAPLWLGSRMSSSKRDYWQASAYARGPLILDMLRREYGREAVLKFMYTYLNHTKTNRRNQTVSGDIEAVLEAVIPDQDFEQFMKDYVFGNKVVEGWESKQRKR